MNDEVKLCTNKCLHAFPRAFLNNNNELILEPKNNIYFRLADVSSEEDFSCKMIAWLSRPSCKGLTPHWQRKIRNGLNFYLNTQFDEAEWMLIYTHLGNDVNRALTIQFIRAGFDLQLLRDKEIRDVSKNNQYPNHDKDRDVCP